MIRVHETHSAVQSSVHNSTAQHNKLFVVHFSHYPLHSIRESQCISLSSMSSSQTTCPHDSSCHSKGAVRQRREDSFNIRLWSCVMELLPASPELWV